MARCKPYGAGGKSYPKKREKFKQKHPEGRKKFAAQKELDRQKAVRSHHQERGHVGHVPHARKVLANVK